MKKSFIILIGFITLLLFTAGIVLWIDAANAFADPEAYTTEEKEKEDEPKSICPKTLMNTACMTCHLSPTFEIRKKTIQEKYNSDGKYFPHNFKIMEKPGYDRYRSPDGSYTAIVETEKKPYGYYLLYGAVDSNEFDDVFEWLQKHPEINHLVIDIHSGGGSMFGGKRIISVMDEFKATGGTIEIKVHSIAASAAFLVLLNGTPGMRYVHPQAEIMWHELLSVEGWFPKLVSPADKEDEAEIMRHWQDTQDEWVASKCKLTKEEVTNLIRYKELWCNGREAVEKYGFADKLNAPFNIGS